MSRVLHGSRSAWGSRFCMERDLHGSRSAWVAICMGCDLHGGRISAWSAFCIGCPARGGVPERRRVVVSGADERRGALIVLAWRGFVVLGEQAAAHIAAAAQARAPVPTRVPARALARWVVASWRIWRARAYDNCSREGNRNHISFYATGNGSGRSSEWKVRNWWRENCASGADA
jgi:hypothetical protein